VNVGLNRFEGEIGGIYFLERALAWLGLLKMRGTNFSSFKICTFSPEGAKTNKPCLSEMTHFPVVFTLAFFEQTFPFLNPPVKIFPGLFEKLIGPLLGFFEKLMSPFLRFLKQPIHLLLRGFETLVALFEKPIHLSLRGFETLVALFESAIDQVFKFLQSGHGLVC
jgi:hypothetical protein